MASGVIRLARRKWDAVSASIPSTGILLAGCLLMLTTGCDRKVDADVLDQSTGDRVVYATTECVVGNPDGVRCDKKTCKTDDESNCADFARKCLDNGHHYSGTNDAGTCSRVY